MVGTILRRMRGQDGLRPFDPYRDVRPVADLIALAFGDKLGPAGRVAVKEMQRAARWEPLLRWFYLPGPSGLGVAPGFVWVEDGRVVGNVSLRRSADWGGFFIGNVAVHPDHRGRGIGGRLMDAALKEISARRGRWVGLEVRTDNVLARQMYERLGFREVGRTVQMVRPAGAPWVEGPAPPASLRRAQGCDSRALIDLVQAAVPEEQRPLLELRRQDYQIGWERMLDQWLQGRREAWWVAEEEGSVRGAVRALRECGHRLDRLEVLVAPERRGTLEPVLVRQGLASLRRTPARMVESTFPDPAHALTAALAEVGFERVRVLAQMRLDLGSRIPVPTA